MSETRYDDEGNVAIVPVDNFAEGDHVMIGKGKVLWRIYEIGRQEITLRRVSGNLARVLYVKNWDADDRMRKVER